MSWKLIEAMEGAKKVVEANVNPGDNVLIIGSTDLDPVAYHAVGAVAAGMGCEVTFALIKPRTRFGEEPPRPVAEAMKGADVVFQSISTSMYHSRAALEAVKAGSRQVSMYFPKGQEIGVLQRAAKADLKEIQRLTLEAKDFVADALKKSLDCHIASDLGTDFKCRAREDIDYVKVGFGALVGPYRQDFKMVSAWPPATIHVFVDEDSANGVFVADGSMSGVGPIKEPLKMTFKDGWMVKIEGGEEARKLETILENADEDARHFSAEIGMATNPMGQHTGFVAEDKRSTGTVHIAIGSAQSVLFVLPDSTEPFGRTKSLLHMDAVAKKATLEIGGKVILDKGQPCW